MAILVNEVSRTFGEYLLIPGLTTRECTPQNVSLQTPLVRFARGEESRIRLNIPFVSAIMQSVSNDTLRGALLHLRLAAHRRAGRDGTPRQEV